MKVAHLSGCILALTLVGNVTQAAAAEVEGHELLEVVAKHLANLEAFVKVADSPVGTMSRRQGVAGLQTSSLATGTLQPAIGLTSTARGLTPLAEWSRIFPRQGQR